MPKTSHRKIGNNSFKGRFVNFKRIGKETIISEGDDAELAIKKIKIHVFGPFGDSRLELLRNEYKQKDMKMIWKVFHSQSFSTSNPSKTLQSECIDTIILNADEYDFASCVRILHTFEKVKVCPEKIWLVISNVVMTMKTASSEDLQILTELFPKNIIGFIIEFYGYYFDFNPMTVMECIQMAFRFNVQIPKVWFEWINASVWFDIYAVLIENETLNLQHVTSYILDQIMKMDMISMVESYGFKRLPNYIQDTILDEHKRRFSQSKTIETQLETVNWFDELADMMEEESGSESEYDEIE